MKVFVILLVIIIAITFVPQSFSACIYDEKTGDFVEPCSGLPTDRIIIKDSAGNQITPVLNKEVFFHYNVQNYGNQSQTYDLDISVNNDDTNLPIFHKKIQLVLEPDESKPIVWSFTPTNYGNYSAKITKNEITLGNSFSIDNYSKPSDSEMNYSEFQSFCSEHKDANWDLLPYDQRTLRLLCNFVEAGLPEKYYDWFGTGMDWKNFAQNVAIEYAQEIPLFVEKGDKDSLAVDASISGRDSFPPPMYAYISFYYDEDNKTKRFGEKYNVRITGELIKTKDTRLPPLKLFNIGYHLDEIQCKQNLILIQKYDGSPACVTESTKTKLIERGWTARDSGIKCDNNNDFDLIRYSESDDIHPQRLVAFLKQGTTGVICLQYISNLDNEGFFDIDESLHQRDSSDEVSSNVVLNAIPNKVSREYGTDVTVAYEIHAKNNSTGISWINLNQLCDSLPVVVWDEEPRVSENDIPVATGVRHCPAKFLDVNIIGYSGLDLQYHSAKPT